MAQYPNSIPSITNPNANDPTTAPSHAAQHQFANDELTAIATELGTLPKGTYGTVTLRLDALEASVAGDELVAIDSAATAGYIGAASNDGVLRTGTGLSYTDGGDFITLAVNADYSVISGNDGATDVTGAELETLTDGSTTTLHDHDHDALTGFVANEHIDHSTVSVTGGTGLAGGGTIDGNQTITLSHLGIQSLADPDADRIMFWDDSSGYVDWLTVGTGLSLVLTGISLSHLGIEALSDPNAHRLMAWDDTDGSVQWVTIGANLTYTQATHTLSAAAAAVVALDDAYNNGNTIDVDTSPVTLTVSDTDNNLALDIVQNDTTNNPDAAQITNAGTGTALALNATGNGAHISLVGDPAVGSPADGDLWWTGTQLNFYNGAVTRNVFRKAVILKIIPDDEALTSGDGKMRFTVPPELNGMNLVAVGAHVYTASVGSAPTIQIHNQTDAVDMLSTRITIDVNEVDSSTAATPAVINTSNDDVVTADVLRIDVDVAGPAGGLEIRMSFE